MIWFGTVYAFHKPLYNVYICPYLLPHQKRSLLCCLRVLSHQTQMIQTDLLVSSMAFSSEHLQADKMKITFDQKKILSIISIRYLVICVIY